MNKKIIQIEINEKKIYLLPTAHVSNLSRQDVIEAVETIQPDSICVELDQQRYEKLTHPDAYQNQNIEQIIKEKKVNFLLVNLILSSFQRRMASHLNSQSGGEMIEAIHQAKTHNKELVLADRSISITFSRIYGSLSFFAKIKMIYNIISSLFDNQELSEKDLSNLQKQETIDAAMHEISANFPEVKRILVDERDQYLAHRIKSAKGHTVLAVLGAAHIEGVSKNLTQSYSIEHLDQKIKKSIFSKILSYVVPTILIGMLVYLGFNQKDIGLVQIRNWFLINGTLTAIGVLLVRGKLVSALVAFIVAPFTILHPLLAAGWFAGLMEAKLVKPQVKDFETLADDTKTIKGFFTNKVTRILLVVVAANLFATIAAVISSFALVQSILNSL